MGSPWPGLLAGIFITLVGSLLFSEWAEALGGRLNMRSSVLGSLVSPIFTSAPEAIVITISLVLYGNLGGQEVGLGTIIGEPLVISTVVIPLEAFLALLLWASGRRGNYRIRAPSNLWKSLIAFLIGFPLIIIGQLLASEGLRAVLAALLLAIYVAYAYLVVSYEKGESLEVKSWASGNRGVMMLTAAGVASIIMLYYGSTILVSSIIVIARLLDVSAVEVSALLVPVVTALPESIASIVWVLRGLDELGVSALLGEAALTATVYPAAGLLVTRWYLDPWALTAIASIEASFLALLAQLRHRVVTPHHIAFLALFAALVAFRGF